MGIIKSDVVWENQRYFIEKVWFDQEERPDYHVYYKPEGKEYGFDGIDCFGCLEFAIDICIANKKLDEFEIKEAK